MSAEQERQPEEVARPAGLVSLATLCSRVTGLLREAVRGPGGEAVVVLPHLDVLTSSMGGVSAEAREIIPLPPSPCTSTSETPSRAALSASICSASSARRQERSVRSSVAPSKHQDFAVASN